jgi:hypothetical protein
MTNRTGVLAAFAGAALVWATASVSADQVTLQNGDTYHGRILSVSSNAVVFQSDVLGQLTLPRAKVSAITLGSTATNVPQALGATNHAPRTASVTQSNVTGDLSAAFQNLGSQTNLVQQVQAQFLATAGPEANAKFNQMMADLMSGKMNLGDLRSQAKSAADQLRAYKKELGSEVGGEDLDSYLAILDSFVAEVAAEPGVTATNAVKAVRQ